jgi:hypothetical protein
MERVHALSVALFVFALQAGPLPAASADAESAGQASPVRRVDAHGWMPDVAGRLDALKGRLARVNAENTRNTQGDLPGAQWWRTAVVLPRATVRR